MHNEQNDIWFLSKVEDGTLEIFKDGRVYNAKTQRFIGATGSGGYPKISMMKEKLNDRKIIAHMQIHRLIWLACRGPIPEGMQVNHIDGNKENSRLENLELTTAKENTAHAYKIGVAVSKTSYENANAVFSPDNIREYRERFATRLRKKSAERTQEIMRIASKHGTTRHTVYALLAGRTYGDIH